MSREEHKQLFRVSGMTCGHCQAAIESAIRATDGVQIADVDLKSGMATVEGNFADEAIIEAVKEAGYTAAPDDD
ncbi:MAG: heavy-metal-associated domain-containing protein [Pirellulaceae bacterium]|nr:heavy-metal-associated domain-containing protein [Pirellulaceae bacterium]